MLPTTERQLRKKFQSILSDCERRIEWLKQVLSQEQTTSSKRLQKILLLESKLKKYKIFSSILIAGIMLYLILILW